MPTANQVDILIKATNDLAALTQAKAAFNDFFNTVKLGVGINVGGQIAHGIEEIPRAFRDAIAEGIHFNAMIETSALGIAAALTVGYKDFHKALAASGPVMDLLRQKSHDLGLSYEHLIETFSETSAAMSRGGVNGLEQQVNLTVRLTKALAALGITGAQAAKDTRDIFAGRANQTLAAPILGLDDASLKQAIASGGLYDLLMKKLEAFGQAGTLAADSFTRSKQRLSDDLTVLEAKASEPIFEALKVSFHELDLELNKPEVALAFKNLAADITKAVQEGTKLTALLIEHADVVARVGVAASVAATAFSALVGIRLAGFAFAGAGVQMLEFTATARAAINTLPVLAAEFEGASVAATALGRSMATLTTLAGVFAAATAGWQLGTWIDQLRIAGQTVDQFDQKLLLGTAGIFQEVKAAILKIAVEIKAGSKTLFDETLQTFAEFERRASEILNRVSPVKIPTAGFDKLIAELKADELKTAQQKSDAIAAIEAEKVKQIEFLRQVAQQLESEIAQDQRAATAVPLPATPPRALPEDPPRLGPEGNAKESIKEINRLLGEEGRLLRSIRDDQQLVSDNPFAGVEEKQARLHVLYQQELEDVQKVSAVLQAYIALHQGDTDPAEVAKLEELKLKLHEAAIAVEELRFKIDTSTPTGEFQASMVAWVNSFGTAAQQAAGVITSTLNVAISQTAKLLTDAIFRTGDWKAALIAVGEAGVQAIIKMVLQWVISRTVMSILNAVFGKADATAAQKQAGAAAKAWSAAAVSASIATEGVAAGTGTIAYIAGLASGVAAAGAVAGGGAALGLKKGGFTGSGSDDEPSGHFTHRNEYVHDAQTVRNHGIEALAALARGQAHIVPKYASGGRVSDDGFQIEGEPRWLPGNTGRGGSYVSGTPSVPLPPDFFGPQVQIGHGGGVQPGGPQVEIGRGGGTFAWGGPTVEIGRGGAAVDSNDFIPDNDPNRVVVRGSATGYNASLQTPFGFATPNNYAIGETIPTNGQPWIYGGRDAPIGSIVGVDAHGQTIIQGASGARFVGTPSANTRLSGAAYDAASRAQDLALMASQADGGAANFTGNTGDEGHNIFGRGSRVHGFIEPGDDTITTLLGGIETVFGNPYVHPGPSSTADVLQGSGLSRGQFNALWLQANVGHHAEGGRMPGAPSRVDSILAMLANGEHVIKADDTAGIDQLLGRDFLEDPFRNLQLLINRPRFAEGGRAGGGGGASFADSAGGRPVIINHAFFTDMREAMQWLEDSEGEKWFVNMAQRTAHQTGLATW